MRLPDYELRLIDFDQSISLDRCSTLSERENFEAQRCREQAFLIEELHWKGIW